MDYTEQLNTIISKLGTIADDLSALNSSYAAYNDSTVIARLDSLLDLMPVGADSSYDYTASIQKLCELVAYLDLMTMILTVVLVIGFGLVAGISITKWFRNR